MRTADKKYTRTRIECSRITQTLSEDSLLLVSFKDSNDAFDGDWADVNSQNCTSRSSLLGDNQFSRHFLQLGLVHDRVVALIIALYQETPSVPSQLSLGFAQFATEYGDYKSFQLLSSRQHALFDCNYSNHHSYSILLIIKSLINR